MRKDISLHQTTQTIEVFINKNHEGLYFQQPFNVPKDVYQIDLSYQYPRQTDETDENGNITVTESNIIDLALINSKGEHVGATGSDYSKISISESFSSPGYSECVIEEGEWNIVAGAYKVQDGGVTVTYNLKFHHKKRQLFLGDLHVHTTGSDGNLSLTEMTDTARKNGLDFVFVTDHNNYKQNFQISQRPDITVMPGVEWTHFQGHANFLGVKKPFDGTYYTNSKQGVVEIFKKAQEKGAIVVLNHFLCDFCPFKFGMDVPFDALEVWNGPMKPSDMRAVFWWHEALKTGRKIPVVGGSDFHKSDLGRDIGFPATCVYSGSRAPSDILKAILGGNSFITCSPSGPTVDISCNDKFMGETVQKPKAKSENLLCEVSLTDLKNGDIIRILTGKTDENIKLVKNYSSYKISKQITDDMKFLRVEVLRALLPGLPEIPALISNPIYFG